MIQLKHVCSMVLGALVLAGCCSDGNCPVQPPLPLPAGEFELSPPISKDAHAQGLVGAVIQSSNLQALKSGTLMPLSWDCITLPAQANSSNPAHQNIGTIAYSKAFGAGGDISIPLQGISIGATAGAAKTVVVKADGAFEETALAPGLNTAPAFCKNLQPSDHYVSAAYAATSFTYTLLDKDNARINLNADLSKLLGPKKPGKGSAPASTNDLVGGSTSETKGGSGPTTVPQAPTTSGGSCEHSALIGTVSPSQSGSLGTITLDVYVTDEGDLCYTSPSGVPVYFAVATAPIPDSSTTETVAFSTDAAPVYAKFPFDKDNFQYQLFLSGDKDIDFKMAAVEGVTGATVSRPEFRFQGAQKAHDFKDGQEIQDTVTSNQQSCTYAIVVKQSTAQASSGDVWFKQLACKNVSTSP
ncbi:MAG: hypothetical protein KGJ78_06570 [Alphaproteobacteria bacterium]|nr:hypothetical protein [Alphaproteobacteria bacterium]